MIVGVPTFLDAGTLRGGRTPRPSGRLTIETSVPGPVQGSHRETSDRYCRGQPPLRAPRLPDTGTIPLSTHDETLWKAAPDIFVVAEPAEHFIDAAIDEVEALRLLSDDPRTSFVTHTRRTQAKVGPAVVISIVAEGLAGERHTAVVVSVVVHSDARRGEDRLVRILTHLEDQHTRHEDGRIEFEEHHAALRAALIDAVLRVEPGAQHRDSPSEPESVPETGAPAALRSDPRVDAASEPLPAWHRPAVDGRSVIGLALIATGVVVGALAVASGSLPTAVLGVVAAVLLGWIGSRLNGG